jgi:2-polyprenyl-3-methyl-5-hydroxy-6-metoxy-1,4-benzoquinol methylase
VTAVDREPLRSMARAVLRSLGLLPTVRKGREAMIDLQYRLAARRLRRAADGFPIPPKGLNFSVTNSPDAEWYVKSGWLAAQSIRFALARNAINMDEMRSILDFGCGSGRVIRYWSRLAAAVHGTD